MISPPPVRIRRETDNDHNAVTELLREAFGGADELDLVERIRKSPEYINDLTVVAEIDSRIVGFNMISGVFLQGAESLLRILALAPLAVHPDFQKNGIGSVLMTEVCALAEAREEPLIVVLGHKAYYPRFGFERASVHNVFPPVPWPDKSFMVKLLSNYSTGCRGTVQYPPAFDPLL